MRRARIAALLLALAAVPAMAPAAPRTADTIDGAVFDRVWSLVERHYWDAARLGARWAAARDRYRRQALAAPDARALYAVLNAMLAEIGDSHVFATDPARHRFDAARDGGADADADAGEYGFATWQHDGAWRVFAVTAGSPAARAGVRIGWRLAAIDGSPITADWHPRRGERATLDFLDEVGVPRRLALVAAMPAPVSPRRATRLPDGVLLLALDAFTRGADGWIRDEIAAGPRPRALILDLRENGGGEAIAVARVGGIFFAGKRTLIQRVRRGAPLAVPVLGAGRAGGWDGPLAVLVGPRSASGAEALAALIAESGRGETVGERTAGALTGAALFALPDGGELSVAEFDIRTGAGVRLEGVGFTPHHVVAASDAALASGADPVLAEAMRLKASADESGRGTEN